MASARSPTRNTDTTPGSGTDGNRIELNRGRRCWPESHKMKHCDVDYGIEEDQPGLWRWIIYPKVEHGPRLIGPAKFHRREAAVAACIEEINNNLERVRSRKASE